VSLLNLDRSSLTVSKPLDHHNVRRAYRRILKAVGIVNEVPSKGVRGPRTKFVPKYRLYDLRHTFASISIAEGVDLKTVSEALGHADPAFTMKTYQHVLDEMKLEARTVLGSVLTG